MTSSNSSAAEKPSDLVCVVCGASLIDHRPDARHCSPACRVEAHRITAILRGNPSGPYRSVKERLEAAQKGVQNALVTSNADYLTDKRPSVRKTAIGRLISDTGTERQDWSHGAPHGGTQHE
jgi:hypothetical protein